MANGAAGAPCTVTRPLCSTQLENKYVGELTEAKRAAEALATQCAAQSSLVAALKAELDRANAVVTQQRQGLQMTKEQAAVELQHAHDEAEHLRDDVARLQRHIAGGAACSLRAAPAPAPPQPPPPRAHCRVQDRHGRRAHDGGGPAIGPRDSTRGACSC